MYLSVQKQKVKIDEVMLEWSDVLSGISLKVQYLGLFCSLFTSMT